jgi:hypothetical protein
MAVIPMDDQDLLQSIGTGCEDDVSCSKKRLLVANPLRLGRRKWFARRRRPCRILYGTTRLAEPDSSDGSRVGRCHRGSG